MNFAFTFRPRLRVAFHRWPLPAVAFALTVLLGGCDQPLEAVVLRVHHRIFVGFQETHRVAPGETFIIGDTEFTARITGFVPDFLYDNETKKVISASNEMRNPAVRLEVYENDKLVEEVWAFPGDGPPHYGRASMLAFQVEDLIWRPGQEPPKPAAAADTSSTPGSDSTRSTPADTSGAGTNEHHSESTDPAVPSGKQ